MTADAIQRQWAQTAVDGTAKHSLYEMLLDAQPMTKAEIAALPLGFRRFWADHPWLEPHRVEFSIFSEELGLVGQLDCLAIDTREAPDSLDRWVLADWKNVKLGTMTKQYNGERAWHPLFEEWPNTKEYHYRMQLNLYRTVLARHYGIVLRRMIMANFPPETPDEYEKYDVPVVDMMPALALFPWDDRDVRHISSDPDRELALPHIPAGDERGSGLTTVMAYNTSFGLGPGGVWVGTSWSCCGCPTKCKGPVKNCPHRIEKLPQSRYACTDYPFKPSEAEQRVAAFRFERQLLLWPADRLRTLVKDLAGSTLTCWPDQMAHAWVLARYTNALSSGAIALRPPPPSIGTLDKYFTVATLPVPGSAAIRCPACNTPPLSLGYEAAEERLSWECPACETKVQRRLVTIELV